MNARLLLPFACILLLGACQRTTEVPPSERVEFAPARFELHAEGHLRAVEATPLNVPGDGWSQRQLVWMVDDGTRVQQGQVVARFSADQAQVELDKAVLELQRNALARVAKEQQLDLDLGRVQADLAQVGSALAIAQTYAHADLLALARNDVLDAVQDQEYLGEKRSVLRWRQSQSQQRGAAEVGLISAQRDSFAARADMQRKDLSALELRAPHAGVFVLSTNWSGEKARIGERLWARNELATLPDARSLEVELSLPQSEAQSMKKGQAVRLHPLGQPEQAVESTLDWLASAARPLEQGSPVKYLAAKAKVPAEIATRFGWVPGQAFIGEITVLDSPKALTVANIAIDSEQGRSIVRIQAHGRIEKRPITLGVRGPARSQVTSGLHPGDEVLLVPETGRGDQARGNGP